MVIFIDETGCMKEILGKKGLSNEHISQKVKIIVITNLNGFSLANH